MINGEWQVSENWVKTLKQQGSDLNARIRSRKSEVEVRQLGNIKLQPWGELEILQNNSHIVLTG